MYTFMLMTAMAASPETAEFNGFFRNLFNRDSNGCTGTSQSTGCTGSSCNGDRGFGSRLRAFFSGSESCYGSGTSKSIGCSGKATSCCGYTRAAASCQGTSLSCNGVPGQLPSFDYGPPPGDGFAPASPAISYAPTINYPGYALGTPTPAYPSMPYGAPMIVNPLQPAPAAPPAVIPEDRDARKHVLPAPSLPTSGSATRATVVVRVPADATLFAEGRPLNLNGTDRTFVSPPLPGDREYTYTFKAEYTRSGETIARTKKVQVKAGGIATVEFTEAGQATSTSTAVPLVPAPIKVEPVAPVAPSIPVGAPRLAGTSPEKARITVKLPPGATLYVDGKKNDRMGPVREFTTPPLAQGQEFAYQMKAEVLRNGQPETQMTKVTFRAGEMVTVDFTAVPK